MHILIIALVILGTFAAAASLLWDKKETIDIGTDCSTCSGDNAKCEQQCMMEAATKEVEYFDDEELDRFARRRSDQYSDDEAEEFREVLLTLQPSEVKPWNRSLTLREIALPDQVKDEYILLAEEG